jgi:hypothetical protein
MSSSTDEIWRKIVEIHFSAKALYLQAEENNKDLFSFYQPISEWRHAEEHIVRSKSAELGISSHGDPPATLEYIEKSLDSALGHEYRAFFDTCDWLSTELRRQISSDLDGYKHEVINYVIPAYYSSFRPRIEEICQTIARVRSKKDIDSTGDIVSEVKEYERLVKELREIRNQINTSVPRLEEYVKAAKKIEASTILRDKICEDLKDYNHETIDAVLPEYYSKVRPRIEEICLQIARDANGKNTGENVSLEIRKYEELINELEGIRARVGVCIPSLLEHSKSVKKTRSNQFLRDFLIYAIGASVIVTAFWWFGKKFLGF